MADENQFDFEPPSAETVARRALILAAISYRGFVDLVTDDPKIPQRIATTTASLTRLGLDADMTPWEKDVLKTNLGALTPRDRINSSWVSEGLVVLAWALQKSELPAFDDQCDPHQVALSIGFTTPDGLALLQNPRLRADSELQEFGEFIYNVHWRLRDFSVSGRAYNFRSLATRARGEPILRFGLQLSEDDIATGGQSLSRAEPNARQNLTSITQERHRASSWLLGLGSSDFYEASTDT
ncbi:MAG: DUF4272 domain-containing protein [Opitutaceae bacterium]|nr:DUF4272 domain-containing protein [Opitutaceae bacterium]